MRGHYRKAMTFSTRFEISASAHVCPGFNIICILSHISFVPRPRRILITRKDGDVTRKPLFSLLLSVTVQAIQNVEGDVYAFNNTRPLSTYKICESNVFHFCANHPHLCETETGYICSFLNMTLYNEALVTPRYIFSNHSRRRNLARTSTTMLEYVRGCWYPYSG